jgi:hypothetical protein
MCLSSFVYDLIISIIGGIVGGIIGGVISISLMIEYTFKKQRNYQINEKLSRCLNEIEDNYKKKLSEEEIKKQIEGIKVKATKKRIEKDLKSWVGFDKQQMYFSTINYYQYVIVEDTRYFLVTEGFLYPKQKDKIIAIKDIFEKYVGFNLMLQKHEASFLEKFNMLISKNILDAEKYDVTVDNYCKNIDNDYKKYLAEIKKLYDSIDPENRSDLLL